MNWIPYKIPTLVVLIYLLALPITVNGTENSPSKESGSYSEEAVREDLAFLYETLQLSSYNLFLNIDKPDYDKAFEQVMSSITGPMTYLEINRLFQPFVVLAGFSHCSLDFPSEAYQRFYQNGGRWIPFEITFQEDKVLLSGDFSDNKLIEAGDEILSVNGTDIHQLLAKLYTFKQGENEYAKRAFLEIGSFMDSWWYVFGDFQSGAVRIRKPGGEQLTIEVEGLNLAQYQQRKQTVQSPSFMNSERTFKFIDDIAYLHPGDFLNAESHDISTQEAFNNNEFLDFIDSAFTRIAKKKSQHLIVDIRGNNGGDNSFSDSMIAYFADRPFRIASKFSVRTSQVTKTFWRHVEISGLTEMKEKIMTLEDGTRFDIEFEQTQPRTDGLAFKGELTMLVDRFSFSNAAVVAAIVQDYGFGTLVGEETSYTPSSCAAIHTFKLPNSGMGVVFPKACSVRPSGETRLRGVIPEHLIHDDPFTPEDEILGAALKVIRKEMDPIN